MEQILSIPAYIVVPVIMVSMGLLGAVISLFSRIVKLEATNDIRSKTDERMHESVEKLAVTVAKLEATVEHLNKRVA